MPNKCVVGGCSNAPDLPSGIGLHTIPFFGDERHEAKKRRKKWVDFVKAKRAKWEPTKNSVVCTKHFRVQILDDSLANLLRLHYRLLLQNMIPKALNRQKIRYLTHKNPYLKEWLGFLKEKELLLRIFDNYSALVVCLPSPSTLLRPGVTSHSGPGSQR
ncbi:uncharacterized protein LOC122955584 [Acropora millepora]|uniref:uncharacterized protein LOC122955584 n=1 Tax=Acropora millepora TaxID=45264 RepID=UPI001CF3C6A2|nr:uncharacterized protein LOC122955584 [Acropora millepora]